MEHSTMCDSRSDLNYIFLEYLYVQRDELDYNVIVQVSFLY